MWDILPMMALAAAGGMGVLAVQHPKQFNEVGVGFLVILVIVGFMCGVINMTMDATLMEVKYEIPPDKRDEALIPAEKWQRGFGFGFVWCAAASIYLLILSAISDSILKERDSNLQNEQKEENNSDVPEGE